MMAHLFQERFRDNSSTDISSNDTSSTTIRLTTFRLQVYLYPLRLINRGRFLIVSLKRAIYSQESSF